MRRLMISLAFCMLIGCAVARPPEGGFVASLGKAEATQGECEKAQEEDSSDKECTKASSEGFSEGFVNALVEILSAPGALLRGVGSALP